MGQKYVIIYMYYSNGNNNIIQGQVVFQGYLDLDCYIGIMYLYVVFKNSFSMDYCELILVYKYNYLFMFVFIGKILLFKYCFFFY